MIIQQRKILYQQYTVNILYNISSYLLLLSHLLQRAVLMEEE